MSTFGVHTCSAWDSTDFGAKLIFFCFERLKSFLKKYVFEGEQLSCEARNKKESELDDLELRLLKYGWDLGRSSGS